MLSISLAAKKRAKLLLYTKKHVVEHKLNVSFSQMERNFIKIVLFFKIICLGKILFVPLQRYLRYYGQG